MSLESSLESLAGALKTHAEAMQALAAAIKAAPAAANAERFESAAKAATPTAKPAAPTAKPAAPAAKAEAGKDWEAGGGADIEEAIPVAPGEDPQEPPFDEEKAEPKALQKAKSAPDSVAERAPEAKKVTKEPEAPKVTLESARKIASAILKAKGADVLRGLLDDVGVKKLSALDASQIAAFCANASKALEEA